MNGWRKKIQKWTVDLNQYACESLRLSHPETNEIKPPETLVCCLRPYQKQALYWMSELEKGTEAEQTTIVLHPCWAAYRICDEYALFLGYKIRCQNIKRKLLCTGYYEFHLNL
ncbi:PREDICTED: DNA repair protein rad8-like [Ipomoea nil]|uniref:DNA repair protein rad8-like n=1 Tax=Ipomoea nil TaxID=35883 RepID=UPI000901AA90|nr:PREDICTED: DNA repair protein rad8-like [Ipomoea nil]